MDLFVDTTKGLTFGILDNEFNWLDFRHKEEQKVSAQIHFDLFECLERNKIQIEQIQGLFYISGPGSYTGMRVAEGIGDLFELEKKNVYSFYHFDIPLLCGQPEGVWATEAFKKEYFVYEWNDKNKEHRLMDKDDFLSSQKKSAL